jgi:CRP/FNR family transcriptional regulator, cyclic AMP receptor protein
VSGEAAAEDLLEALSAEQRAELEALGAPRRYARGQPIFYVGQVPDDVVVVHSGRVKVSRPTRDGREVVLAFRGAGALLGELGVIDGRPRVASVIPLEPVEAIAIPGPAFRGFLERHPSAALALLGLLARRLRDADAKRQESASLDALGRVGSRLLELCERYGEDAGDGAIAITLPITQDELAGWTGASIEAVGRALATMRGLGWVQTRRREITVVRPDALRAITEP